MLPRSALLLVPVILVGCSHPAVRVLDPGPPKLVQGWTVAEDADSGVKLGIVPGWRSGVDTPASNMGMGMGGDQMQTDPNNAAMAGLAQQVAQDSVAYEKKQLEGLRKKGIVLHVIDSSKPTIGEERTRYTVRRVDQGHNVTLDGARDEIVEEWKGWGATPPTKVNLPIGPAYKIASDYKTRGGDEVERITYVAVNGKYSYQLSFISTNNPSAVTTIADEVAKTWRIDPNKI